jgi:hypothetical protein
MRTKSLAAIVVVASIALTGCSNEDFSEFFSGQNEDSITALIVSNSRSDVTEAGVYSWTEGDAIDVWSTGGSTYSTYTAASADDAAANKFTGGGTADKGKYASYPSDIFSGLNDDAKSFTVTLPTSIGKDGDTYVPNANTPMLGTKGEGSSYEFKHLGAALRFVVNNIPASGLTEFRLTTIGGEKINGTYTVSISDADPTITLNPDQTEGSDSYSIKFSATSFNDDNTAAHFIVPIPAGTYSQGFKVELLNEGTVIATSKLRKEITLNRADLGIYPEITLDASEVNGTIEDPTEQSAALQSLQDAFENGGEYTFTHSISLADVALTLPAGKTLTLDLNGKTLHVDATVANRIKVAGDLTIKDSQGTGKILDIAGASSSLFWIGDPDAADHATSEHVASLTIEKDVTIIATKFAFIVRDKSKLTINGGSISVGNNAIYAYENSNIEINDGSIVSSATAIWADDNSTITITGGTISATTRLANVLKNATVTVSGGELTSSTYGILCVNSGSASTINIKGGTISASSIPLQVINKSVLNISGGEVSGSHIYSEGSSQVNVSGGKVHGTLNTIYATGTTAVTISDDAEITSDKICIVANDASEDATDSPSVTITGGKLKAGDGSTATESNYNCYAVNMTTNYGAFTMSGGTIESSGYGAALLGYTKAVISAGTINARAFALSGNGNYKDNEIIYSITGGTLKSTADFAVYLPNSTESSISGTAKIEGEGAIAIQRGTVTIDDSAEIIAHGTKEVKIPASGDGTNGVQYACVSAPARYGNTTVNIKGGKFTSGTYSSIIDVRHNGAVLSTYTRTISITGGTFDKNPAEYTYDTYTFKTDDDGNTTVATTTPNTDHFVPDGYTSTQNNDNTWTVSQNSGN